MSYKKNIGLYKKSSLTVFEVEISMIFIHVVFCVPDGESSFRQPFQREPLHDNKEPLSDHQRYERHRKPAGNRQSHG